MHAWTEVCHLLQSSKSPLTGFLSSIGWRITEAFFKHSPHTNSISNSAILRNNYISLLSDLCACVHVKKNGIVKEAIVLQWAPRVTSNLEKSDGLVHCSVKNAAVLCENHRERVTQIWTNSSEEEEEERKIFWPSGDFLVRYFNFAMIFSATGCVVRHETLEDERYGVITAYKLAVLEMLRNLFVLAYIACPRYPYI